MTHLDAKQGMAVEKYLLGEMTAAQREEFEEHLFECDECASDLKATAAFLDAAKAGLRRDGFAKVQTAVPPRFLRHFLFRPNLAAGAFACLLLLVLYQNTFLFPHLRREAARWRAPEVLASLPLIGTNARGADGPARSVADGESLLLSFDVPPGGRFGAYSAQLVAPTGETLWSLPVSAAAAGDTVSVRTPPRSWSAGEYTLILQGYAQPGSAGVTLSRLRFLLNTSAGTEQSHQQPP